MKKLIVIFPLALGITNISFAAEAKTKNATSQDKPTSVWKSEAELGYVKTTGNTETESTNFKVRVDNERTDWKHSLRLDHIRNANNTGTTAEKYLFGAKTAYNITAVSYAFARLQYEDDRFSGYDYQTSLVGGYGHHIYNTKILKWDAEVGAGVRQNEFEDEAEKILGNEKIRKAFLGG